MLKSYRQRKRTSDQQLAYKATGNWDKFIEVTAPVEAPAGKNDLYFVFSRDQQSNQPAFVYAGLVRI